ncbi:MAG: hypothetical protein F6K32_05745 [Desertifilum sp. SIO1I2]|nr:hypothetical protein [Desertifilum sp. SIO1I2]
MSTINLTTGNDVVSGTAAADIFIVPAGSTGNDFLLSFQTQDRINLTALPTVTFQNITQTQISGGVRLENSAFGTITLTGISVVTANNFIFAGTEPPPPTGTVYVLAGLTGTPGQSVAPIDPDGSGPLQPVSGLVFGQTAFGTIQTALDYLLGANAPDNVTVRVAPGTYNEFVNFVRPFNLLGPNAGRNPVTNANPYDPVTNPNGRVPEAIIGAAAPISGGIGFERGNPANTGRVTIDGFSFRSLSQPAPGTQRGYGIDLTDSNGRVTIRNNIFANDSVGIGNQISTFGPNNETQDILIEQNLFNMVGGSNVSLRTPFIGIGLQRVTNATIQNNNIRASTGIAIDPPLTTGQGGPGPVPAPRSSGFTITGNQFSGFEFFQTPGTIVSPPSGQAIVVAPGTTITGVSGSLNNLTQANVTGLTLV